MGLGPGLTSWPDVPGLTAWAESWAYGAQQDKPRGLMGVPGRAEDMRPALAVGPSARRTSARVAAWPTTWAGLERTVVWPGAERLGAEGSKPMADATFWNKIAEHYAAKPVDNPEAFERKIAVTKELLTPEQVVFELGCGTGSLALRLAPWVAEIRGLDLSPEMVRIARDKASKAAVDNVAFEVGAFDSSFTTLGPSSVDGVCAFSILHLLEDRADALARIFALLKPGGFFVSSTTCLGGGWVPYGPLLKVMKALKRAPAVWVFSEDTLRAEMEAAGFVDLDAPEVGASGTLAFLTCRKPT